jgi:cell division protein FtsQ
MKSAAEKSPEAPGRSWRSIRQDVSAPAMSRQGHRRRLLAWLKLVGLTATVTIAGWAGYQLVHSWETDRAALTTAVHSAPVRETVLITDGVLSQKWVNETLALPKGASLMALDLPALRDRLTAYGQIRVAVLTRSFPDTLVVTLQERSPVARVQASEGLGLTKQLLVAKDGTPYEGIGYDSQLLATLPWLDGVRLVKDGRGYAPIAGMSDVSALLSTAQLQAPHLYRGWLIVSLARLDSADEITVKAQDVPQVVFSRKRDFYKQVAQLDYVMDAARSLPEAAGLQSVNLTLEGQVPVRLQGTPDELVKTVDRPDFSLQPPSQRKQKRDL